MLRRLIISGLVLCAFLGVAEESKMNALQSALSATTISGYVDTSVEWVEYDVVPTHPQVPTSGLARLPNWGTDILHYFVRDSFTNTGVETSASAVVTFSQRRQGKSDQCHFLLLLRKLAPTNTYTLLSSGGAETNFTEVVQFQTDARGSAVLSYKELSNGNGQGRGAVNGFKPFPAGISNLTSLTGLAVANASTQVVLSADLTVPDRLQYFVKKQMESPYGAGGLVQIWSTARRGFLSLQALNLMRTNPFHLALNGVIVTDFVSDAKGRWRHHASVTPLASPLNLKTIELVGTNLVSVLWTELP